MKRIGALYSKQRFNDKRALSFVVIYLYRRLIYVLVLLCLPDYPALQTILIIHLSLLNLLLTIHIKPNILKSDDFLEIVNEALIYACSVQMILLSDMVDDPYKKYSVGWSMALTTALVIVFNFGITFFHLLIVIKNGFKKLWSKCKQKRLSKNIKPAEQSLSARSAGGQLNDFSRS